MWTTEKYPHAYAHSSRLAAKEYPHIHRFPQAVVPGGQFVLRSAHEQFHSASAQTQITGETHRPAIAAFARTSRPYEPEQAVAGRHGGIAGIGPNMATPYMAGPLSSITSSPPPPWHVCAPHYGYGWADCSPKPWTCCPDRITGPCGTVDPYAYSPEESTTTMYRPSAISTSPVRPGPPAISRQWPTEDQTPQCSPIGWPTSCTHTGSRRTTAPPFSERIHAPRRCRTPKPF